MHDAILFFHEKRVDVGAFVVMPNHVHLVARPYPDHELETWLGSVKGYSADQINKLLGRHGKLWQQESHDRIVRDLKHLNCCVRYIGRNPEKAGLSLRTSHMAWINPKWEMLGYKL